MPLPTSGFQATGEYEISITSSGGTVFIDGTGVGLTHNLVVRTAGYGHPGGDAFHDALTTAVTNLVNDLQTVDPAATFTVYKRYHGSA